MISNNIEVTFLDKIAIITFFHPKSNSFTSTMLDELSNLLCQLSENKDLNVIILRSYGEKAFCAGASFDELLQIQSSTDAEKFFSGFAKVILAMKNCKIPIITRVQGNAVGGGLGIIAASDYVFATTNVSVKLSELSLGFGPFVIEPAVSRKIGTIATQNLTYNPEHWKDSNWALQNNLFQEVFENIDLLDEKVIEFAAKLSKYSRDALSALKEIFWNDTQQWDNLLFERAKISGNLALSQFTKQKLKEFIK
jgi:methylglutaconyl-CoA hydratase